MPRYLELLSRSAITSHACTHIIHASHAFLFLIFQVGKLASGLPIPSDIPGSGALMDMMEKYEELMGSFPLDGPELSWFAKVSGVEIDEENPPTTGDMVDAVATKMKGLGESENGFEYITMFLDQAILTIYI